MGGSSVVSNSAVAGSTTVGESGAPSDDGGCDCRVSHKQTDGRSLAALIALGLLGLRSSKSSRRRETASNIRSENWS